MLQHQLDACGCISTRRWADIRADCHWKGETPVFPFSAPCHILQLCILHQLHCPSACSVSSFNYISWWKVHPAKRYVPASWYGWLGSQARPARAELARKMRDHRGGKGGGDKTSHPGAAKHHSALACVQPQSLVSFQNNTGSHKWWFKALS